MEPYNRFFSRFSGAGGSVALPRAPQNPEPQAGQVDIDAAREQWERQHPFAPDSAKPQFLRGASAMIDPAPQFSGSSEIAGYDDAGNPLGTTGGVIAEQESDRRARLQRGASALLPEGGASIPSSLPHPALLSLGGGREDLQNGNAPDPSYQIGIASPQAGQSRRGTPSGTPLFGERTSPVAGLRAGAPLRSPTQSALTPDNMPEPGRSAPLSRSVNLRSLQAAYGGSTVYGKGRPLGASALLGDTPEGATTGGILDLATNIENFRQSGIAERQAAVLAQQGALPAPGDTPEVRASKLRYVDVLLQRVASGQDLRVGGSAYIGDRPGAVPTAGNPDTTSALADIAQRAVAAGRQPRVIRAGTTANGRPVEVLSLGNGNFSEVRDPREGETEIARMLRERSTAQAAGDADTVAIYNRAIENFRADPTDRPLRFEEFMQSPYLEKKYGDYGLYREDFARQMKRVRDAQPNNGRENPQAMLERIRQERARRAAASGR